MTQKVKKHRYMGYKDRVFIAIFAKNCKKNV